LSPVPFTTIKIANITFIALVHKVCSSQVWSCDELQRVCSKCCALEFSLYLH